MANHESATETAKFVFPDIRVKKPAVVSTSTRELLKTRKFTQAERVKAVLALVTLSEKYSVGMNRLARSVNRSSDLLTIIRRQKTVSYELLEKIAEVLEITDLQFLDLSGLEPELAEQMKKVIIEKNLFERHISTRNRCTRLRIVDSNNYSV